MTDAWSEEEDCTNIAYDLKSGDPLTSCLEDQELYEYNRYRGLESYKDPFNRLFCIERDYSPIMNYYYPQVTDLTSELQDQLLSVASDFST